MARAHMIYYGKANHAYRHGLDGTPTYRAWINMKDRCLNPGSKAYPNYGGRSIGVCGRWLGNGGFINFLEDMGENPGGLSLGRIDNEGNYDPENCRWETNAQQMQNRQDTKLTWDLVSKIRASSLPSTTIGVAFGVNPSHIRKIRRNERWSV